MLSALSFGLRAEALNESYAFALLGEPKYATDFSHFDYVNPAAPKGGDVRLAATTTTSTASLPAACPANVRWSCTIRCSPTPTTNPAAIIR
ncbi:hypothetical protein M8494_04900 [Serratia ureilytica]